MATVLDVLRGTGPVAVPLVMLGFLQLAAALALAGLALNQKRLPSFVVLILPWACGVLGVLGALYGLHQASRALEHASPEVMLPLSHAGLAYSLYAVVLAVAIASLGVGAQGFGAGLGHLLGAAREGAARNTLGGLAVGGMASVAPLALWVAALVVPTGKGAFALAGVGALFAAVGVGLAATPRAPGDTLRADYGEARATTWLALAATALAGGAGAWTWGAVERHRAVAFASADTLGSFLTAMDQGGLSITAMAVIGCGLLLLGAAQFELQVSGALERRRGLIGLGVTGLLLFSVAGAALTLRASAKDLTRFAEARAAMAPAEPVNRRDTASPRR
ncbi:MAG: hypothetical protein H6741_15030 [Alphaproteobacteria bacterium]|nr:hypothetical protein [Alphaproteobacteria bacterium]MCB9794026.1 hypothetical protein [Alphaproteobacteria bacterium]